MSDKPAPKISQETIDGLMAQYREWEADTEQLDDVELSVMRDVGKLLRSVGALPEHEDDLIAFISARYDRAEARAKAAGGDGPDGRWRRSGVRLGRIETASDNVVTSGEGSPDAMQAAHIAAVDPAHRLRDVALKRAILAGHTIGHDPCDAHDASLRSAWCATVRQLGTEFSGHDGYRPGWAPETP